MMDRIIVVVMMIASAECTGKSGSATTMYERHPRLDDLVFQHHLILESSARSRVECGIKCHKSQSCAAFTYSPSSDTCRQHSCISTSPSPSNHSSGAETWLPTLSAADRLKDFDVEIFAQDPVANPTAEAALCYHYTGPMARGATETLNCSMAYCGRYVPTLVNVDYILATLVNVGYTLATLVNVDDILAAPVNVDDILAAPVNVDYILAAPVNVDYILATLVNVGYTLAAPVNVDILAAPVNVADILAAPVNVDDILAAPVNVDDTLAAPVNVDILAAPVNVHDILAALVNVDDILAAPVNVDDILAAPVNVPS
ncbi:hypothetical protein BaRGS_00011154 [Batillaria attramentaria]|uniref:Apple domain-containing protein n=1 Tax=Batillaria attramentaria TaxID=370345 RepID=A0ABD0LER2_9CAEN